jgi:hypothetical protein
MKNRRLGRFIVSDKFLRDAIDNGFGANLFLGSVPIDVHRDFLSQSTTFLCWNQAFDVVPEGEIIPLYRAIFYGGCANPTWERVDG